MARKVTQGVFLCLAAALLFGGLTCKKPNSSASSSSASNPSAVATNCPYPTVPDDLGSAGGGQLFEDELSGEEPVSVTKKRMQGSLPYNLTNPDLARLEIDNHRAANLNFRISSNVSLDQGSGFILSQGDQGVLISLERRCEVGESQVVSRNVPPGRYGAYQVLPFIISGNSASVDSARFGTVVNKQRLSVGDSVRVIDGKLFSRETIDVFLKQVPRKDVQLTFYSPRELAKIVSEIVLLNGGFIEKFGINERTDSSFSANVLAREGENSIVFIVPYEVRLGSRTTTEFAMPDVSINPRTANIERDGNLDFRVSYNSEKVGVRVFVGSKQGYLEKLYLIQNPGREISIKRFGEFFREVFFPIGSGGHERVPEYYPRLISVNPGEYILEAKSMIGNKFFSRRAIIVPLLPIPEKIKIDQERYSGQGIEIAIDSGNYSGSSLSERVRDEYMTEIYPVMMGIEARDTVGEATVPVRIGDKDYVVGVRVRQSSQGWEADFLVNCDSAKIVSYCYDEIERKAEQTNSPYGKTSKLFRANHYASLDEFTAFTYFQSHYFKYTGVSNKNENDNGGSFGSVIYQIKESVSVFDLSNLFGRN